MTDVFTDDFFKKAVKEAGEAQTASENLVNTITSASEELSASTNSFNEAIKAITSAQEAEGNKLNDTLSKAETAARLPGKISTFIGFFDPDFSQDALRVRAAQSQTRIEASQRKKNNIRQMFANQARLIEQRVKTSREIAAKESQDLTMTMAVGQFGFQTDNAKHQQTIRKIKGLSEDQLREQIKSPGKAIAPIGLLKTELMLKQSQALGVDITKIQKQAQELALVDVQQKRFLEGLTPLELQALRAGDPDARPFGVTEQQILTRESALKQRGIAIKSAQLSLATKDRQNIKDSKDLFLSTLSAAEVAAGLQAAEGRGGKIRFNDAPELEFTKTELQRQFALSSEEEKKTRDIIASSTVIKQSIDSSLAAVEQSSKTIAGASPGGTLPASFNAKLMAEQTKLVTMQIAGVSPEKQAGVVENMAKEIKDHQKRLIDAAPKNRKDMLEDYFANDGKISSSSAATKGMFDFSFNDQELLDNPVLNPAWIKYHQQFMDDIKLANSTVQGFKFPEEKEGLAGFEVRSEKQVKDVQRIVTESAKKSGLRTNVGLSMFLNNFQETIKRKLQAPDDDPGVAPPFNPYELLWDNQNNTFPREFLSADTTGRAFLDMGKINQYMSDVVNPSLRKAGLLTGTQTMQEILARDMREGFQSFFDTSVRETNPEFAAIERAIFGGDMRGAYFQIEGQFMKGAPQAEASAEFIRRQKEAQAKAIAPLEAADAPFGTGAGAASPFPEGPAPITETNEASPKVQIDSPAFKQIVDE